MASARDHTTSLNYEERAIAFIDVLGFSDLVKASATGADALHQTEKLVSIYKVFDWFVSQMLERLVDGNFFSDTFILSATDSQAFYLIREAGNLCRYLLLQGFPCRGAITFGLLHHRERIIIGPALVDAYRAEQSVAIFPRVVLDDVMHEYWTDECGQNSAHPHLKSLVKNDSDGQNYLDIFDPQWASFIPWIDHASGQELVPRDSSQFIAASMGLIRKCLADNRGNEKIYSKYEWLEEKCQNHAAALNLKL